MGKFPSAAEWSLRYQFSSNLSGNNFTKLALFARFLGLIFPAQASFSMVQNKCVVPTVDRYWRNLQATAVEEHRAVEVIISGDGRMDSPRHSAKYCTYSVMNQADKRILAMEVVDKRETCLKSGIMEAKGFERAMASIEEENVDIKEVVTDDHPQVSAIMKRTYPHIRHSYDMWHVAKNLGKKLGKTKWFSVLNHVTNRHRWALGQCDHDPIEDKEDKLWLKPASQAVKCLKEKVTEKRLLRTFPYYVTCQTTSELETFNNHLLMYAPKRNAFRYKRMHSKAANNWTVVPVREAKKYSYIPQLLTQIAMEYCLGFREKALRSKVEVHPTDPSLITKTIAPQPPPPTAELREKKVSRIKGKKSSV